jgi:hypothetical protein
MDKRVLAAGMGLALALAGCTSEPAPSPPARPGPTNAGPTSAVPTSAYPTSAGPTSAGPTSTGLTGTGPTSAGGCTESVDQLGALPNGYHLVAGVIAVPDDQVLQLAPSGERDPAAKLFAKWGLVVRTGETVQVAVGDGWAGRARVGWGNPGAPAASVRITACPTGSPPQTWTAFVGGTWVAAPACVPLLFGAGGRTAEVRLPIGLPCG